MTASMTQKVDEVIFKEGGICLRGERAKRFHRALSEIIHACDSLESSSALFPRISKNPDEIDPLYAVKSFATYTARRFSLLMAAADGEDLIDFPLPVANREGS